MRVRIVADGVTGPNPDYDRKNPQPGVPTEIELAPGTEIEHPRAWIHCIPSAGNRPAIAEPVDVEAVKMTERALAELEKQKQQLFAQAADPPKSKRARRWLMETLEQYGRPDLAQAVRDHGRKTKQAKPYKRKARHRDARRRRGT